MGFPGSLDGKGSACNAGDWGSIPGSEKFTGDGNGYLLQYSCLENSMERVAWQARVHRVTKSGTQLSDEHLYLTSYLRVKILSNIPDYIYIWANYSDQ